MRQEEPACGVKPADKGQTEASLGRPSRSRGRIPMMNESEPLMRHLEGITRRNGLIRWGRSKVAPWYWRRERIGTGLNGQGLHTRNHLLQRDRSRTRQGVEMASKGICFQATIVNLGTPFIGSAELGWLADEVNGGRRPRSSRWGSRPTHGVWESHTQGEGGQLHRMRDEHMVLNNCVQEDT
jgi:hypothetical protein